MAEQRRELAYFKDAHPAGGEDIADRHRKLAAELYRRAP
jgi:hypothetical protein